MKYRPLGLFLGLLSLSLAAACGGSSDPPAATTTGTEVNSATTSAEQTATGSNQGPVAIVDGEEITRAEFEDQLRQAEASYAQQGVPFPQNEELAQLQQELVTQLVQQTLVLQESETRGITASDEEIQAQYQEIVTSFPDEEAFNQALAAEGLTQADAEAVIADGVKVQKLLDSVVQEAQVAPPTEEELRQTYEQASQQQELPPFEEVRAQIEAEVQDQREVEVIQGFVQELEAASTVEILL